MSWSDYQMHQRSDTGKIKIGGVHTLQCIATVCGVLLGLKRLPD